MPLPTRSSRSCLLVGLLVVAAACSGEIGAAGTSGSGEFPGAPGAGATAADPGVSGTTAAGAGGAAGGVGGASGAAPAGPGADGADPGRVGIRRLNNAEYDNTVRDLLGVATTPARGFIADEKAAGFDNIAGALGMTAARYEQYFTAADGLVEEVWQSDVLRGRIVTCAPAGDDACVERILRDFGSRAYRRPLTQDELSRMRELVRAAEALGEPADRAIAQAVKAMLSAVPFLYRVELDPDPSSLSPHDLDPYELASRLSYLLWSTMPDDRLFERAAEGSLLDDAMLVAEVERMLGDARAERFVESFAGQWLGLRALASHQVDTSVFPDWDESLRDAMVQEGLAFFGEFLQGRRGLDEFFTADVSFVDDRLARLYGFSGGSFDPAEPVSVTSDARRGFLGLASFLTFSSYSYRTAPTLRGKWVLENLLCTEIAPPPAGVPPLDDAAADPAALASQNVRVRLAAHRSDPTCAGCHAMLDPIGFGLERFDAIGAYRERYDGGDLIDATGELPDGSRFDGLGELSDLLAADPRLPECASEKLLTYALGRELGAADAPHLERIRDAWAGDGLGVRALITRVALSDVFRRRRGEPEP